MASPDPPSSGGIETAKFGPSKPLEGPTSTQFKTSPHSSSQVKKSPSKFQKKKSPSFTPESPVKNKKKISNDKSKISEKSTLNINSSKTSVAASTFTEKDLLPYWNKYTKEMSKKLWLPTKTGSQELVSNSLNGSFESLAQNSWFSTKRIEPRNMTTFKKTSCQLLPTLWPKTTENDPQKIEEEDKPKEEETEKKEIKNKIASKEPAGKSRHSKLYPNKEEKDILLQWFGGARWTYNQCNYESKERKVKRNKKDLRAVALNSDAPNLPSWLKEIPYDIRDEGMNDLLKAYKSNFAKGSNHRFDIKYRSKKAPQESIVIHAKHWKREKGKYAFLKKIKSSELLPDDIVYDTRLVLVRKTMEFYLCLLSPLEVRSESQAPEIKRVIALDPGVRTFQTGYDPSGLCVEWGKQDISKIYRLCHSLDRLQSKINKGGHKRRWSRKRAAVRIRKKIKNLVKDLHHKLAKWLCKEYSLVLLPEFETQNMIQKGKRRLNSKTARAMVTWSHYRFKQRLIEKSREHPWCKVVIVNEAYTSKTCGSCGRLNDKLGSSKEFKCSSCGLECDRDMHASRNILLRYVTEKSNVTSDGDITLRPTS